MKNENVEAINDLIQINNDRVEGYNKAARQTDEGDLRAIFGTMSSQSSQFAGELKKFVRAEGEEPAGDTTVRGKIYRTWMDVKATFGGDDRKGILASCEFGEDAAQDAYKAALKEEDLSPEVRQVFETQKAALREAHDQIKRMRDSQPS